MTLLYPARMFRETQKPLPLLEALLQGEQSSVHTACFDVSTKDNNKDWWAWSALTLKLHSQSWKRLVVLLYDTEYNLSLALFWSWNRLEFCSTQEEIVISSSSPLCVWLFLWLLAIYIAHNDFLRFFFSWDASVLFLEYSWMPKSGFHFLNIE